MPKLSSVNLEKEESLAVAKACWIWGKSWENGTVCVIRSESKTVNWLKRGRARSLLVRDYMRAAHKLLAMLNMTELFQN